MNRAVCCDQRKRVFGHLDDEPIFEADQAPRSARHFGHFVK
jgi:hypothetical protein